MKKIGKKLICICLMFVFVFSITACGVFGGNSAEDAVEAYVDANKYDVESVSSSVEVNCEFISRGTSVVYMYTYKNMNDFTSSQMADLENSLANYENSIINLLETMQSEENNISSVIYEYYESDGDLIISREYY